MSAPTIVRDLPDTDYHADRTGLSSSGARQLLDSPARYRHDQDNPREETDAYRIGHAVHTLVLGAGAPVVHVETDSWRTKAAKEQRAEVEAAGGIPLTTGEWEQVHAMRDSVLAVPDVAHVLSEGEPEMSLYATHEATGVRMRARPDWYRPGLILDLKTTGTSADPHQFGKTAAQWGYHLQAAWYLEVAARAGLDAADFVFVVVEKTAPHLVSVVRLDEYALNVGWDEAETALRTYRDCTESGVWPGYPTDIVTASLPRWYQPKTLMETL